MATGSPNYAITPNIGSGGVVSIGDTSRTAPTSLVSLMSAGASGSRIERIAFAAQGPTVASIIRLFLHDGTTPHLYYEQAVPAFTPSAGVANWNTTLEAVTVPNLMPILLKSGWSLRASINDTQLVQELALQNIAQGQTLGAAGFLSLNGSSVVASSNNAIAASAAATGNQPYTLTLTPFVLSSPAQVTLTSASTVSAVTFTIVGRDATGALVTETLAGPNATTVYSVNVYKAVLAVVPNTSNAGGTSVGYSASAAAPLVLPSKILLMSGSNLSAVNFTIKGAGVNGQAVSETLAGPNIGSVTSANIYSAVTSIAASAAVGGNIYVGTPAIISGVSVTPIGGDF